MLWSIGPTNTRTTANKRTHKHCCLWTLVSLVTFESVQEIGDNDFFHTATHCSCGWILSRVIRCCSVYFCSFLMCVSAGLILKAQAKFLSNNNRIISLVESIRWHPIFDSKHFLAKRNTRKKNGNDNGIILNAMRFHRMTYPLSLSRLHITFPCRSNSIVLSS